MWISCRKVNVLVVDTSVIIVLYELGALDILVGLVEALKWVNDGAARKYLRIEQLL